MTRHLLRDDDLTQAEQDGDHRPGRRRSRRTAGSSSRSRARRRSRSSSTSRPPAPACRSRSASPTSAASPLDHLAPPTASSAARRPPPTRRACSSVRSPPSCGAPTRRQGWRRWRRARGCRSSTRSATTSTPASCWPICSPSRSTRGSSKGLTPRVLRRRQVEHGRTRTCWPASRPACTCASPRPRTYAPRDDRSPTPTAGPAETGGSGHALHRPERGRGRCRRHRHRHLGVDGQGGGEARAPARPRRAARSTQELMALAQDDAIFIHCLPADRGYEVDAEVIDGPQSVVVGRGRELPPRPEGARWCWLLPPARPRDVPAVRLASRWDAAQRPQRIAGVDLARGLAVLGMFAAHLLWIERSSVQIARRMPHRGSPLSSKADRRSSSRLWRRLDRAGDGWARPAARLLSMRGAACGCWRGPPLLWALGVLLILTGVPVYVILPAYALLFLAAGRPCSSDLGARACSCCSAGAPWPSLDAVPCRSSSTRRPLWRTSGEVLSWRWRILGWHYPSHDVDRRSPLAGLGAARAGVPATGDAGCGCARRRGASLVADRLRDRTPRPTRSPRSSPSGLYLGAAVDRGGPPPPGCWRSSGSGGFALAALGACLLGVPHGAAVRIALPLRACRRHAADRLAVGQLPGVGRAALRCGGRPRRVPGPRSLLAAHAGHACRACAPCGRWWWAVVRWSGSWIRAHGSSRAGSGRRPSRPDGHALPR